VNSRPLTVLTVNAGSTSVKLRVLSADDAVLASRDLGALPSSGPDLDRALVELRDQEEIGAVAHRVVHGGALHTAPSMIDDDILTELASLDSLAPTHTAPALHAVQATQAILRVPHVACFDTAFHATMSAAAATYAIPLLWRERYGLRRYGFHGLSHAYAARRAATLLGADPARLRLVTCHLGGGASLAAVLGGRSVDTTMGLTPLDGLVMATRSGSIDPGLVLWLARQAGISLDQLADALEHESGLLALAGRHATVSELLDLADNGDDRARLAVDVYLHRLAGGVAAMTAALSGLDALVFTGGIGEHEPRLRHETAERLRYLGVELDPVLNADARGADAIVSPDGAASAVLVVRSREDLELARAARRLITGPDGQVTSVKR
jgi:acetate kinase